MIPYVAFESADLAKQPKLQSGDSVMCPRCGESHQVQGAKGGSAPDALMVYSCLGRTFLAGIDGKSVINSPKREDK